MPPKRPLLSLAPRQRRWLARARTLLLVCGLSVLLLWAMRERALLRWDPQLLVGLLLSQLSMVAFSQRFRAVMRLAGLALGWLETLRILSLAVFYHCFVPLSVGSELTKFLKLRAAAPTHRAGTLAAVLVVDHAVGFVALLGVALSLLVWRAPLGPVLGARPVLLGGAALVLVTLLVLRAAHRRGCLPRAAQDALRALPARRAAGVHVLHGLAWSLVTIGLLAAAVVVGSAGWHLPIAYPEVLFVLASAGIFQLLPLNVAGVGAGDLAGVGLYLALGLSSTQALMLVSLLYGYRLAMAMVGAAWALAATRARRS
ncbi:MAG: hypothetical protein EXR83_03400 [Gammaproteobacteria bacterium]|nr:hypothetical protein [Gammaproteobacteria bacterium]